MTRVFVTGMGLITGLGTRVGECFDAVLRGETAARPVDRFVSEGFDVPVAAPADRARVLEEVGDSKLPFVSALIVHCARQALTQAGLSEPLGGIPLFVANTIGSPEASERPGGWSFADPAAPETVERYGQSPLVARAAEALGARGRVDVVGNTCAAGNYAIGLGLEEIRRGRAKRALVGGAEELSVLPFCAFSQLRAIGDPCRPFDRARNGMLFGEGGAMLVLESEESMRDRGAKPLAEVLAVGYSNDAYHLVAPDPAGRGLERALRQVLDNAPLSSIDYVNAHGTGTELNDAAEAQTLCRVFGTSISVSSTKGSTGHCMGGASAVEAVIAIEALRRRVRPPSVGLDTQDDAVPVRVVAEAETHRLHHVLSVGLGFGGNNAVLALGHPDAESSVRERPSRPVYVRPGAAMVAELRGVDAVVAGDPLETRSDFDPKAVLGKKGLRHVDRGALLFAAAMELARSATPEVPPERLGACVGGAFPVYSSIVAILRAVQRGGPRSVPPMLVPFATVNCASSWWLMREGVTGYNGCPVSGECAALHAVAWAEEQVASENVDAVFAGATEGYSSELWEGLGRELVEGAAGVWVAASADGARARLVSSAFAFDRSSPHDAFLRASEPFVRVASRAFVAGGEGLAIPCESVEFDGLSVSAAVALLRALERIEPGEQILVASGSREGFAAALLIEGV